eukprot:IDg12320t1
MVAKGAHDGPELFSRDFAGTVLVEDIERGAYLRVLVSVVDLARHEAHKFAQLLRGDRAIAAPRQLSVRMRRVRACAEFGHTHPSVSKSAKASRNSLIASSVRSAALRGMAVRSVRVRSRVSEGAAGVYLIG